MTVSTLSLGVTTNRAAEELAALTTALKSFKSALVEFNGAKARNPLEDLKGSTDAAVAGLKTRIAEVEGENKKLSSKLEESLKKATEGLSNNLRIQLKSAEMTGKLVIDNAAKVEKKKQDLADNSFRIQLKSAEMWGNQLVKQHEKTAREAVQAAARAEKDALRYVKQGDLGLSGGSATIKLDSRLSSALRAVNGRESDQEAARYRAYWDRAKREADAARQANAHLQSELDRVARDARLAAERRAATQLLNETGHRQIQYRQVQAQSRGDALNMSGTRAAELANLRQGLAYGPDRSTILNLRDRYNAEQIKEVERATRRLSDATSSHTSIVRQHKEEQAMLHSTLRGVAGGLDNLWLTYGRYIPQMVAAYGVTMTFRKALAEGAEFDYQTKFIETLGSSVDQSQLKAGLFSSAAGNGRDVLELASALRTLQQTGVDAAQGLGILNTSVAASVLGETDMKTATEDLVGVMEVFGLHAKKPADFAANYERVGDVMAKVSQSTKANLHQVAQSLQGVVGVAEEYGVSLEKAAVVVERLGKAGIVGSRAGTYSRGMIEAVYSPISDRAEKRFASLGIESFDKVKGEYKQLDVLLTELFKKLNEFKKPAQNTLIDDMFRQWDRKPLRQLKADYDELVVKFGEGEAAKKFIASFEGAMKGTDGLLADQRDRIQDNAKTQWVNLGNDLKNALIGSFTGAEELFKGIAVDLRDMVKELDLSAVLGQMLTFIGYSAKLIKDLIQIPFIWETLKVGLVSAGALLAGFMDGVNILSAGFVKLGAIILDWVFSPIVVVEKALAAVLWAIGSTEQAAKLDAHAESVKNLTSQAHGYVAQVMKDFENGETNVQRFNKAIAQGEKDREAARKSAETKSGTRSGPAASIVQGSKEAPGLGGGGAAGSLARAESKAIAEEFRNKERMARQHHEFNVAVFNDELQNKLISDAEYNKKRLASYADYTADVLIYETNAKAKLSELKDQAVKESEKKNFETAQSSISNQIKERAEQEANDRKLAQIKALNKLKGEALSLDEKAQKLHLQTLTENQNLVNGRDNELMTSGDRAAVEARIAVMSRYESAVNDANVQLALAKELHADTSQLATYQAAYDNLIAQREQDELVTMNAARAVDAYHRSIEYGTKHAFATYADAATNSAEQARQLWSTALGGIEQEMARFIRTGKSSWRSLANAILDQMARIAAAKMIVGIGSMIGGAMSNAGSAGTGLGASGSAGGYDASTGNTFNGLGTSTAPRLANGGYFDGTVARFAKGGAFTNAIYSSPTLFRFAQGGAFRQGLMGEAGPEAVMPLTRDSSGRLGVRSSGGGDSYSVQINVAVSEEGGGKSKESGDMASRAGELGKRIEAVVRNVIVEEKRSGGLLAAG